MSAVQTVGLGPFLPRARPRQVSEVRRPGAPPRPWDAPAESSRGSPGASKNAIASEAGGNKAGMFRAIDVLVGEGHLERRARANNTQEQHVLQPYRQAKDPESGLYEAGTTSPVLQVVSGSGPYTGEPGTTPQWFQELLQNHREPPGVWCPPTMPPLHRPLVRTRQRSRPCDGTRPAPGGPAEGANTGPGHTGAGPPGVLCQPPEKHECRPGPPPAPEDRRRAWTL